MKLKSKPRYALWALAAGGVTLAGGLTIWALRPQATLPQTPPGAALQALASPIVPDPEWLTNPSWLLQKFCTDGQGRAIATTDPSVCATPPIGRSTDDSLNQLLLWTNQHKQNAIATEAQRFIAKAIEFTNTPGHPCHQQPLPQCYQSFEKNLSSALSSASDPAEIARLTAKTQALAIARSGQSPRVGQASKLQIQQAIERYSQDLAIAKSAGIDGAIEMSRDIQEAGL